MAKAVWIVGLLALTPFVILAGCTDCVEGPPVSARGITDAPSSAGLRGYALGVLVTDGPGGAALPGAGVVVYYGSTDVGEWSGPRVEVGPDTVLVEPMNATGTVESKSVERMMTDADGHAIAHVPENRIVGVVVAMEGFTEEWVPALATGTTRGTVTIPLYRESVVVEMDAVWRPAAASTGAATESDYGWDPHPVEFGSTSEADRGYAARIVEMKVTIQWENGLNGGGDLGIGVGPPDEGPRYFHDASNDASPGARSESAVLQLSELAERGILGASSIEAGAATDSAFVAPFGLPYTMQIEARFDTARANLGSCNMGSSYSDNDGAGASVAGHGALAAMLSLTGAAFLARSRPWRALRRLR